MALNDRQLLDSSAKGANIYPGVANPTISSGTTDAMDANFVKDPTTPTLGAGAGPNFQGHMEARRTLNQGAGVIEQRPGIIESTNIDPLNENSNKDDGWANATAKSSMMSGEKPAQGYMSSAAQMVTGGAQMAYGHVMGDEASKKAGQKAVYGEES
ncbi:hypothetical protein CPB83DRAFT_758597 [Crepidotus variabilis]|uniref:Uncharacterized protein n=1 Tax=Crepidotus variabilis TaxID=179855 RepID=A0A9P6EQ93_9AGAR|nr:hypothetical protein CPB83DRAFT_758597 [Crepidotus variabilis]